jgi:hypothetical protein
MVPGSWFLGSLDSIKKREVPYEGDSLAVNHNRIRYITNVWSPVWATEDLILTNFGRTRIPGQPNYVQLFLTESSLDVCVHRMRKAQAESPVPLYPEIPHLYIPGPDDMNLATFFRR